jgi:hypothetical protein
MTRDPSASWRMREPPVSSMKKTTGNTGKGAAAAGAPVNSPTAKATTAAADAGARKATAATPPPSAKTSEPTVALASIVPRDLHAGIQIKGLKGTVNKVDVQQAMEMRQGELDVCIANSRRGVRWVGGAMRVGCKVDPKGRVIELRLLGSNLGHRGLERCVTDVVASTEFSKPSGNAIAEFAWAMSVEPVAGSKPPDPGNEKLVAKTARKHAREAFKTCEARRGRVRLRVTAYVGVDGRVLSAGAVPTPPSADDKVDCLLDELRKWHFAKPKRASKVSFELK